MSPVDPSIAEDEPKAVATRRKPPSPRRKLETTIVGIAGDEEEDTAREDKMERKSIADELYSEILDSKADIGQSQTSFHDIKKSQLLEIEHENWCEDGSSFNGSDEKLDPSSDLNREWQKRKNQFHAIGYRDGLIEGKEASAQEGFNIGFKESVIHGFNWGLIRGVTGALDCLPGELREKMIESKETRSKFHELYNSMNNLSTTDALKMFQDVISKKDGSVLDGYYGELESLIVDSPKIEVKFRDEKD
ncbi:hypothetical protein L1887_18164 [Cichorium endivia]|nr:hypothetical protein L1887_18164 [Cichorium endivia]